MPDELAARELLTLITSMVGEFKKGGRDAIPEATVHAQYIAIVCMLRPVGHVLQKADCVGPGEKNFLDSQWAIWKSERIFATFIEPTRNDLLKEFKSQLQLRKDGDVSPVFYADPGEPSGATIAVHYEADKLQDVHGRKVMPLFKQAIAFWDKRLGEVEAFRALAATP